MKNVYEVVMPSEIICEQLNSVGRRRLEQGVQCFVHLERGGKYSAVCIDFGVTGSGDTLKEAQDDLVLAVSGLVESVAETGNLENLLNSPNNRAAEEDYKALQRAVAFANLVLLPLKIFDDLGEKLARPRIESYKQPVELPHASYA